LHGDGGGFVVQLTSESREFPVTGLVPSATTHGSSGIRSNALTNKGKGCYYRRFSGIGYPMTSLVIDAFEFCRLGEQREGEFAVADLPRLARESVDGGGTVKWSLRGGSTRLGHPQLTLAIAGAVRLMCQRCLTPFEFALDSQSMLVLAKDEGSADEIDELLDDDEIEVIVGSRSFSVADLVEDEALLMIPSSPKHQECPSNALPEQPARDDKASPFAVLKNLKKQ